MTGDSEEGPERVGVVESERRLEEESGLGTGSVGWGVVGGGRG